MGRRRLLLSFLVAASLFAVQATPAVADPTLDLETLTGPEAEKMMEDGDLTSVELTKAYIARIKALNKSGPGLNAVTQWNKDALNEAQQADDERAAGTIRGPAHGLPILMKDLIDVKGMYTSAGNFSLRNSFPAQDAGLVKKLREHGVVILGKLGLSEFANFFGNQPSGFSNLTGQVINGIDADQNPSGSSSGTGAAAASALSTLTIGTETSGSIISPSQTQGIVGLRPTVGLVPGTGIAPISASQDTAGPMDRTVAEAAMTLQSIAGWDPDNEAYYHGIWGPGVNDSDIIPPVPHDTPDYMSALDMNFVQGKRIGYNGTLTPGTPLQAAYDALVAHGAIMVQRNQPSVSVPASVLNYEAHRDVTHYYQHLGPDAPIQSLEQEIEDNQANPQEALKFGNSTHTGSAAIDISDNSAASVQYRQNLVQGKQASHDGINSMINNGTPSDPSDDVIAILGSVPQGPRAGYPQITIPMGYNATTRRTVNVSVNGNAYSERDLLGIAYVIEQSTKLRKPASEVDPSMYRCARTDPPEPFSDRGACNPDFFDVMDVLGDHGAITLPFPLETETVASLQDRMTAGTLTSEDLVKAYLTRIAYSNAEGPATQAVRSINADAIEQAKALDEERASRGRRGPLHGIPVIVDDSIDVAGMPTTGGSIALQDSTPTSDSLIVKRLKAAGAIILGKANVTELGGLFDGNIPEGYSSLGGQVLMPSDTDKTPAGSSAGSAAATASGLAGLAVGLETSTDTAQLITPAGVAGVVGFKPTVGRISRTGVLGVARTQDAPGTITRSVADAAAELQVLATKDPSDSATSTAPSPTPNYLAALSKGALKNKRVGVISSTTAPYPDAVAAITGLGATTVTKTIGTPSPNPASIVSREFKRDLNAYLATVPGPGAKSLQQIIDYNTANADEGLKYQQGELTAAQAVDLNDAATASAYNSDKTSGLASNKALIDTLLNNGTPSDTTDDVEVMMVPSGNPLVGIADRAGYPIITVPAGYGTGSAGRNPIGVTFVGAAYSEPTLLADAYAFEQATNVRDAPSVTNPSMWRCVPGSKFFSPHHCHPGDAVAEDPFPEVEPPSGPTGGTASTPVTPTESGSPVSVTIEPPAEAPAGPAEIPLVAAPLKIGKVSSTHSSLRLRLAIPAPGSVVATTTTSYKHRHITLGRASTRRPAGGDVNLRIKFTAAGVRALRAAGALRVTLKVRFTPFGGTAQTTSKALTVGSP